MIPRPEGALLLHGEAGALLPQRRREPVRRLLPKGGHQRPVEVAGERPRQRSRHRPGHRTGQRVRGGGRGGGGRGGGGRGGGCHREGAAHPTRSWRGHRCEQRQVGRVRGACGVQIVDAHAVRPARRNQPRPTVSAPDAGSAPVIRASARPMLARAASPAPCSDRSSGPRSNPRGLGVAVGEHRSCLLRPRPPMPGPAAPAPWRPPAPGRGGPAPPSAAPLLIRRPAARTRRAACPPTSAPRTGRPGRCGSPAGTGPRRQSSGSGAPARPSRPASTMTS